MFYKALVPAFSSGLSRQKQRQHIETSKLIVHIEMKSNEQVEESWMAIAVSELEETLFGY